MVTVARLLNLTLVVPELDKASFWADPRYIPFLAFCSSVAYFYIDFNMLTLSSRAVILMTYLM